MFMENEHMPHCHQTGQELSENEAAHTSVHQAALGVHGGKRPFAHLHNIDMPSLMPR